MFIVYSRWSPCTCNCVNATTSHLFHILVPLHSKYENENNLFLIIYLVNDCVDTEGFQITVFSFVHVCVCVVKFAWLPKALSNFRVIRCPCTVCPVCKKNELTQWNGSQITKNTSISFISVLQLVKVLFEVHVWNKQIF